jgi:hypothetical protein
MPLGLTAVDTQRQPETSETVVEQQVKATMRLTRGEAAASLLTALYAAEGDALPKGKIRRVGTAAEAAEREAAEERLELALAQHSTEWSTLASSATLRAPVEVGLYMYGMESLAWHGHPKQWKCGSF